jgi:hypothetical protein
MRDKRQIIPVAGLVATMAGAGYMVIQLYGQGAATTGDFTKAATAEVRDPQRQVVLRGQFAAAAEQHDDEDVERKATLTPTGIDADAAGEAEVEYVKVGATTQEVEFSVHNLQPGITVTFVIDGTEVATATVNKRGRAELELDVKMPGATASR